MSYYTDRKTEQEAAFVRAYQERNYAAALTHAVEAAKASLVLAQQTDGAVAAAYMQQTEILLGIAKKIKKLMAEVPVTGGSTGGSTGASTDDTKDKIDSTKWELTEKPNVKLADVAGMEEVKRVIDQEIRAAIEDPELFKAFKKKAGAGILLYGPPGTGKTFIAKAIAGEFDAAFFAVTPSTIKSKYVGETEQNIKALFEAARKYPRAIIFFDEADALLKERSSEDKVSAVPEFLQQADGMVSSNDQMLILLGGTNNPWAMDSAVVRPGRMGTRIYVGLPDLDARRAVMKLNFKGAELDPGVDLNYYAKQTERYSCADVKGLCERAKSNGITRCRQDPNQPKCIMPSDLDQALQAAVPSVTPEMEKKYLEWNEEIRKENDG